MGAGSRFIIECVTQGCFEVSTVFVFEPAAIIGCGLRDAFGILFHAKLHIVIEQVHKFRSIPIVF